ncbi:MAG: sialidase family protein, partial [Myxococcota bacterium]
MTFPVRAPEGGAIAGLAVGASGEGDAVVVAATSAGVYVRPTGVARWERKELEWPTDLVEGSLYEPLSSLRREGTEFTFPREELFTYALGALWLLSKPSASRAPVLLTSEDMGSTWSRVAMPAPYALGTRSARPGVGVGAIAMARAPIGARADLRLATSEGEVALVDATHVWKLRATDLDAITTRSWVPVDLHGVDLERAVARDTLPSVIRHYLPASRDRTFETLTVLGAQLMIYRRTVGNTRWVLTGTQATIDRQLIEVPGSQGLYMLEPNALVRSVEQAESWERIRIDTALGEEDEYSVARIIPVPKSASRSLVLIATRHGAILRSPDSGRTWTQVRSADPDRRGITSIAYDPRSGTLWASTEGQGVLRSDDRGATWSMASDGIHAVRPMSMVQGFKGELLLGADAGLFELTGSPRDGTWTQVHDRGTSALFVDRARKRVFSGTTGGSIIGKGLTDGRPVAFTPRKPRGIGDLFVPASTRGLGLGPNAVAKLTARPDSEVLFARTQQRGTIVSKDAGRSWSYAAPNKLLVQANEGAPWTQFVVGSGQTQWLLSQPTQGPEPAQLWRTENDGATWHVLSALRETDANERVWLVRLNGAGRLLLARPDSVHISDSQSPALQRIEGPWDDARVVFAGRRD